MLQITVSSHHSFIPNKINALAGRLNWGKDAFKFIFCLPPHTASSFKKQPALTSKGKTRMKKPCNIKQYSLQLSNDLLDGFFKNNDESAGF